MSDAENNSEQPITPDENEKLAAIKLAEANHMDPNIIRAMREAPASSALIDAASRAKTPAEMMEQFANLDPATLPPEMRLAVQQFKEQQEQKKLEDDALLKKAALAAEAGFMAFASAVTTANRAEAAEANKVQDVRKMSETEKADYFERLSQMTAQQWLAQTDEQKRQDVSNLKISSIELISKFNENNNNLNEKAEAYFEEKYAHLPPEERAKAIEKAQDEWYEKNKYIIGNEKMPEGMSDADKLKWIQGQLAGQAERMRELAEKEQDPKLREIMLQQAEETRKMAEAYDVSGNATKLEGKPPGSYTEQDGQAVNTDAGRLGRLQKAEQSVLSADNEVERKQAKVMSHEALDLKASDIKTEEAKASIDASRLNNFEAQANALELKNQEMNLDFDTPQPEAPRKSMDLTQLERAQQMMTEFDANSQKPANDAEGPKVAAAKAPTVSNS